MIVRYFLKSLFLPPATTLLLMAIALLSWYRWPRFSRLTLVLSLISLYTFSSPFVASQLLGMLERQSVPFTVVDTEKVIVVLGGGRRSAALEYEGSDSVNLRTLERLRYGAQLHRRTQLPLLVSGGRVFGDEVLSEAQLMARTLRDEFGVPVQWLEVNSRTTAENAFLSAELLRQQKIDSIVLVTHGWHMPRAKWVFEQAGLSVTPAPMGFSSERDASLRQWMPSAQAMLSNHYALHEILGGWVYRWSEARTVVEPAPAPL